jgi:diguanylate cyclase (GGDEF)-like protein/PAS domain S-box-containing protein
MLQGHPVLAILTGASLLGLILHARHGRRKAEQALAVARRNEDRLRGFLNNSPLACSMKDEAGRFMYRNQAAAEGAAGWHTVSFPFVADGHQYVGGLSIDLRERDHAFEALRDSETRFRTAFVCASIGMAVTSPSGRILEVNNALCRILGYEEKEMLELDALSITHPDDRPITRDRYARAHEAEADHLEYEKRYIRKDGSNVCARVGLGAVRNSHGEITHFIALVKDISREKQAEELARLGDERWHLALEATNDGIWDWDAVQNTVYYSARWKEMLGFAEWELPNRPDVWDRLVHPEDLPRAKAAIDAHLARKSQCYTSEYRIRAKDGSYKWVLARGKAIFDANGSPLRLIGAHTDITERKCAEERLFYQASFDSLTGLMNRGYFLSWLDKKIAVAHAKGQELSLCICDVDRFKSINDRYGHRAGDDVLVNLARILQESVRNSDISGRLGGDEFCVLLNGTNAAQAAECLERVRDRFQTIAFGSDGRGVFTSTASFGVASLAPGMNSGALIEAADRALYAAKKKGRNLVASEEEPFNGGPTECDTASVTRQDLRPLERRRNF